VILFDFSCESCNHIEEYLVDSSTEIVICPNCSSPMTKSFLRSGSHRLPDTADWIYSVLEVVDKSPGPDKPCTREFLKNPTRTNYTRWMKECGLRPMDYNGLAHTKPTESDIKKEKDKMLHDMTLKHITRQAISVGRR
jgi:hypothetical protein